MSGIDLEAINWAQLPCSIDPVAMSIGPVEIRWYGLMYLIAAAIVYVLTIYRIKSERFEYTRAMVEDFLVLSVLCMLIGGRLGYVLFYNLEYFIKNPLQIISPFEFSDEIRFVGIYGMSYHGGLIGIVAAFVIFCKKQKINLLRFVDLFAPSASLGYMFGRIGNFINGELYGRVTEVAWGMYFPMGGAVLRHPSQLYEAFFEGFFLFMILWILRKKRLFDGFLTSIYLVGYGFVRFFIEFVREPDEHLGFVIGALSMGQILCLVMIACGAILFICLRKRSHLPDCM